jgi:hypothetical protein
MFNWFRRKRRTSYAQLMSEVADKQLRAAELFTVTTEKALNTQGAERTPKRLR